MTLRWIAGRLHMGSWTYVSNLLHENDDNDFVSIVRGQVTGDGVGRKGKMECQRMRVSG